MDNTNYPESRIKEVKTFITELQHVQDAYFKGLVEELGLISEGEEWLFDYIYNWGGEDSFKEYLKNYDKTFGELK